MKRFLPLSASPRREADCAWQWRRKPSAVARAAAIVRRSQVAGLSTCLLTGRCLVFIYILSRLHGIALLPLPAPRPSPTFLSLPCLPSHQSRCRSRATKRNGSRRNRGDASLSTNVHSFLMNDYLDHTNAPPIRPAACSILCELYVSFGLGCFGVLVVAGLDITYRPEIYD